MTKYDPEISLTPEIMSESPGKAVGLLTPEIAQDMVERKEEGAESALLYLTSHRFLWQPEQAEAHALQTTEQAATIFSPRPGIPTKEHLARRIILASTMNISYSLIACEGLRGLESGYIPWQIGEPRCYFRPNPPPLPGTMVELYDEGSPEDIHMRSFHFLARAARNIRGYIAESKEPFNRYTFVWNVEEKIRDDLKREAGNKTLQHHRNSQLPDTMPSYPLADERVNHALPLFWRNAMLFLRLVEADAVPGTPSAELRAKALQTVRAAEIAATYSREVQRSFMGTPGANYDRIRGNHVPHMVVTETGQTRIANLEKTARRPSLCPAQHPDELPPWIRELLPGHSPKIASAIGLLLLPALKIAPNTLWATNTR